MPFKLMTPDVGSLPQTPAGKMQVFLMAQQLGIMVNPERVAELIGLKSAYGLSEEDFMQMGLNPMMIGMGEQTGRQTSAAPVDMASLTGAEQVPPAER